MLEKAKAEERVAIYSGELLTKEQADRSSSKYIVKVGKYYLDGRCTTHAVGRYANYAPADKANARLRAGTKPTWDPIKRRWWISIRAKKTIKPGDEIKIPYGQAYKGLPKRKQTKKTKVKPMLRQAAAVVLDACDNASETTGWRRACGRLMQRITTISQKWRKTMHDMQVVMTRTKETLQDWHERRQPGADRAQREEGHPSRVTGGSTSPAVMSETTVTDEQQNIKVRDRLTWAEAEGRVQCNMHTSARTQYPRTRGRTPRGRGVRVTEPSRKGMNPDDAIKRARIRAVRKIARKERQTDVWKTFT